MNFLAHALLSFNDPEILVGNMISDFVKGRQQYDYPERIRQGIVLHRLIDSYTDDHAINREARNLFRPDYRLYCGAFLDITYDHFLANDQPEFGAGTVFTFSQQAYDTLDRYSRWLPPGFAGMLPYMKRDNWLYNYRHRDGIARSYAGLVRRAQWIRDAAPASLILDRHYEELKNYYASFWPQLKEFARGQLPPITGAEA